MILYAPPTDRYIRDPLHGHAIPEGRTLANLVAAFLPRLHADAVAQIRLGSQRIDLSHWLKLLTQTCAPVIDQYWRHGYRERAQEILATVEKRRTKSWRGWFGRMPDVVTQVARATGDFVLSVVHTLETAVNTAVQSGVSVLGKVHDIFTDPRKATSIGATESHRAGTAGAITASEHSGVVSGLRWLCSAGACRACLDLEGKVVAIGEPFVVLPGGGPWATVFSPPLHPS